jgi:hypothetical protein
VTHETEEPDGDHGDEAIAGRWYASKFRVGQNAFQFNVDCGRDTLDGDLAMLYFRVIASPTNARELFRQLGVGLLRYADSFGPIDENGEPRVSEAPP